MWFVDREGEGNDEDEEEAYERRKLERKLRDKEAAYQEVSSHCFIKFLRIFKLSNFSSVFAKCDR